jgi:tripartite-type tricarboxylate transporter receptor subunit TctC
MIKFAVCGVLACCWAAGAAVAQGGYPLKPVRIVVPTATGGPGDTVARLIAQPLTERLGRQVVVENRTGAGTMIGGELVAKAPADGHTLLMGLSTLATNPTAYRKVPYDAVKDFSPVTQAVGMANLLVIHPSVPARNVREFIALARARPGEILYGSSGIGTNPHLTIELFSSLAGIRLTHVPYKSSTSMIDVIAGQIALTSSPLLLSLPHARAGRLRVLGATGASRVAIAPEIPTIAENGLPGFDSVQWYGLLAPAGTPREIIERLHREVAAILRGAELRNRLAADGAEVVAGTPEEFAALLRSEIGKWARVAKAAGIVPE